MTELLLGEDYLAFLESWSRNSSHGSSSSLLTLQRKSSTFANDESRKATFKGGAEASGDGTTTARPGSSAVIKYLEENQDTQELYCKEDALEHKDLQPLHRLLVERHSFIHLHSLELPNNHLTAESCPELVQILTCQQQTLSKLDLSHNPLTAVGLTYLVEHLRFDSNVKILNLTDTSLGSKGGNVIASLLRPTNTNGLQELYIAKNSLGSKGIKPISTELMNNTTLRVLDVSSNTIKTLGATSLATALTKAVTDSGLRILNVSDNKLGDKGIKSFANLLLVDRRLEGLYAGSNYITTEGAEDLSNALKTNYTLKDLRLDSNDLRDEGCVLLAESLGGERHATSAIERLTLRENNIGLDGVTAISQLLKENESLRHIDLSANEVCSAGAQALANSLAYNLGLQELILTSNQIDDEGAYALTFALGRPTCTVTKLCCEGNPLISDKGEASLLRVRQLRRNLKYWFGPLLRRIMKVTDEIICIDLTPRDIDDEELLLLTNVLESSSSIIRPLCLSGFGLSRRSLIPFCERILGPHSKIAELYISKCDCGDDMAAVLSGSLSRNTSLEIFSLVESHLTTVGVSAIAKGISDNDTLRCLYLDHNCIDDDGMRVLGGVIPKTSIESLSVTWNSITDLSMMDFEFGKCLHELRLDGNRITDDGALTVCRHLRRPDTKILQLSIRNTDITESGAKAIRIFLLPNAILESDN